MAKEVHDKQIKEEHLQLAAVIKGVHKHLRQEFRTNSQDFEQVWQKHTQNQPNLQLYADAMYRLATEHWSVNPQTRIDWCRQVAIEYFHQNGLQASLQKDAKRHYHELLRAKEKRSLQRQLPDVGNSDTTFFDGAVPTSTKLSSLRNESIQIENLGHQFSVGLSDDCRRIDETPHNDAVITVPFTCKIRLLDVGSCYNPFLGFNEFDVVSIDLSPAKQVPIPFLQTVLQCDFLDLRTTTLSSTLDPLSFDLQSLSSPLQQLPCCSFHVVVFSLLLEYLPSAAQRWQCCVKAHSLLAVNGLLLVVTPDSNSQHRNAPMMKCWKQAIESLGFLRWKYEKQNHIHCMAFRKVGWKPKFPEALSPGAVDTSRVIDMLYIPQDFTGACYDNGDTVGATSPESPEDSEEFVKLAAAELPMFMFEDC